MGCCSARLGLVPLLALASVPGGNLWAVGYMSNTTSGTRLDQTLIELWNGKSWQVVPSPNVGIGDNDLYGVVALSSTDAWAVGSQSVSNSADTLVEHWNGTQWSAVSSPDPGSALDALSSVVALGVNNVWAVGYYVMGNNPEHTLTLHWGGKAWKVTSSPNSGSDKNILNAVVRVPGTTQVWAMGSHFTSGTDQSASLALFRC
jgi:hypothetical protein